MEGRVSGSPEHIAERAEDFVSEGQALAARLRCWNEPNFTRPMAVANSGWSSADFKPLMELVFPSETGS